MRICYFVIGSDTLRNGYHQKIFRTVQAWRDLGCETLWMLGSRAGSPAAIDFERGLRAPGEARLWTWKSGISRIVPEVAAGRFLKTWAPDITYIRNAYFTPGIIPLLNALPACLEINTTEDAERKQFGPLQYAYFRFSSAYVLKRVRALICVTREIARLERYVKSGKPIKVIANGIPLAEQKTLPAASAKEPVLAMMATGNYAWHGLDKIAALAREFPKWTFHIMGDAPAAPELAACQNVRIHGLLKRSEYEPILAQAHVGIGPLALHRKQMEEACPLKVREYLSFGLPVMGAYEDTDIPEGSDFFLRIANSEENVCNSFGVIEAFVKRWMHRRVDRGDIAHLDYHSKERERLEYLAGLAGCSVPADRAVCA